MYCNMTESAIYMAPVVLLISPYLLGTAAWLMIDVVLRTNLRLRLIFEVEFHGFNLNQSILL